MPRWQDIRVSIATIKMFKNIKEKLDSAWTDGEFWRRNGNYKMEVLEVKSAVAEIKKNVIDGIKSHRLCVIRG